MEQQQPDWPPQRSAVGLTDGHEARGSTGQLFRVKNGRWERVRTVKVKCSVPNGMLIRISKPGYDDGTGDNVKTTVWDGPGVRLNGPSSLHAGAGNSDGAGQEPGETEVDAEWFDRWLEQNKINPLVADGHVQKVEEKENPTQQRP
jgi:hypothetical protein